MGNSEEGKLMAFDLVVNKVLEKSLHFVAQQRDIS